MDITPDTNNAKPQAGQPRAGSPANPPGDDRSTYSAFSHPASLSQALNRPDAEEQLLGDVEGENSDATIISARRSTADEEPEQRNSSKPLNTNRHSSSVMAAAQVLLGKSLDHFELLEMIGGGGMGAVFRARDTRLDRIVAVKVIPAAGQDPDMARRFKFEAQSAAKLDHPHIARVYYVGEVSEWSYIVFEYVDGINLRDLVHSKGPLGLDEAVWFTRQVAEALAHASARFVVHRDVKPSNVLVTKKGLVKLVDMGLARTTAIERTSNDLTASNITLGTFDYISPEQARDPRSADVRSDLYSLGCTLYYLLSGKPPFPEGTAIQKLMMHGNVQPVDIRHHRIDVPDELAAILHRLMEKNPNRRYQEPVELINDLYLLAEFENLPRSRQAGTISITPTIEDVSILESLLPWMIVIGLLCGVTLWMQSMHSVKSAISLPHERFIFNVKKTSNVQEASPYASSSMANIVDPGSANSIASASGSTRESVDESVPGSNYELENNKERVTGDSLKARTGNSTDIAQATTASQPDLRNFGSSSAAEGPPRATSLTLPSRIQSGLTVPMTNVRPEERSLADTVSNADATLPDNRTPLSTNSQTPAKTTEASATSPLRPQQYSNFPFEDPYNYKPRSSGSQRSNNPVATFPLEQSSVTSEPTIFVDSSTTSVSNANYIVARSLEEALSISSSKPQYQQIVLMNSVRLSRKVRWDHPALTIRSGSQKRARIEISPITDTMPQFLSDGFEEQIYGFEVGAQSLRLIDVDLLVYSPESNEGIVSAFGMTAGSEVELQRSTITLMPSISGWRSSVFATLSRESRRSLTSTVNGSLNSASTTLAADDNYSDPVQIQLSNSVIRGNGDFLIEPHAVKTEVQWMNGLLALDGRMIDYQGAAFPSRTPLNIRFELQEVTVAAQRGLSRLQYDKAVSYPVCLSFTTERCAYVSDADTAMFEFEGVDELADLKSVASDVPSWTRWLDVRGIDNAYDTSVRELIRLRYRGRISARFDFEIAVRTILSERSPESSIRWVSPPHASGQPYRLVPGDFLQRPGSFNPGMQTSLLPPLESTDSTISSRN